MWDNSGWLAVDILYEEKLQVGLLLFYLLAAASIYCFRDFKAIFKKKDKLSE